MDLLLRLCRTFGDAAWTAFQTAKFQDEPELTEVPATNGDHGIKLKHNIDGTREPRPGTKKAQKKLTGKTGKFLKARVVSLVLSRKFSEDCEMVKRRLLDPRGQTIHRWNKIFLIASLVSLFVDPLFFYSPAVRDEVCIEIGISLEVILTIIRSVADVFYMVHIFMRFRTAYVTPSSGVFGRGEPVIDSSKIAMRYLCKGFWLDFIAALPLPQVLIWIVIPNLKGSTMANTITMFKFILTFQYLPRLFQNFSLSSQIVKATEVVTETAWAGAAYNLMLYMLTSHVLGACWYLFSIERQEACWRNVCILETSSCEYGFLDCHRVNDDPRVSWFIANATNLCSPDVFQFGIFDEAVTSEVASSPFLNRYIYCLWWGLRNLISLGQGLHTSTYIGEIMFVAIGLVFFGLLINNMQTYLQSTTVRLEEWRLKRTDTEQWMHHRQLPSELRQSVRKYDQHKWLATRGVDEEALLKGLPVDLRRDIKRHLCLDLVRGVPLFDQMDERMLDAICERLKPALCTEGTFLVREGDPVNEILFIIRGHLDSYTTNGGSYRIGPGDFCGEELMTWALDPRPSVTLPSSTRTVKSISEVEAFALIAEDLKFVASQFRRLHSEQLRHKSRFFSHQWRTWAAYFIQSAWRRYKKRKEIAELRAKENPTAAEPETPTSGSGLVVYATRLAMSTKKGVNMHSGTESSAVSSLRKPAEPDFSVDE